MFLFLSKILQKKHIDCFAPISLEDCKIVKPYLLEKCGIQSGTAVMLAVPYFTNVCLHPERNISAYAVSRDYHLFFSKLFDEILPLMRQEFPQYTFAGFADHSPIAETEACARAGLGIIGKNHMLITKKYSSYVFLGEIITDAAIPAKIKEISYCENCGRCLQKCPMKEGHSCLSALTQKKGALTDEETSMILKYGSAWGCDICQEVCPHTKTAITSGSIFSPIPFFSENRVAYLTASDLDAMPQEEFLSRAYAWRGRDTIRRNLKLLDQELKKGDSSC